MTIHHLIDLKWKIRFHGKINEEYPFEMFGLYTYYFSRKNRNNILKNYHKNDAFKGTYVILDLKKQFNYIKIIKNKINLFDKNELVETNNEKFNKYLEIHSEEKELTSQILTQEVIEFLAEFREKYGIEFDMIFKDKKYIRFYTRDMFEPKVFGKFVDKDSMYKYFAIIEFLEELVERIV